MLTINKLTVELGGNIILDEVCAFAARGEKIGVIGVNGAGKSTLFKSITNHIEYDGDITILGSLGYMSQELVNEVKNLDCTIGEYLILHNDLNIEEWEISRFLNNLNMADKTPESSLSELSGGQKIKVEIIRLLFQEPDILLLDEPTNFLDIPSAEWLMKYLMNYPKSVIVISHDLRLMNRALDRIWYVNELTHKIESFNGNYEEFLAFKEKVNAFLVKQIRQEEKKIKRMYESALFLASRKSVKEKRKAAKKMEQVEKAKVELDQKKPLLKKSKSMKIFFPDLVTASRNILKVSGISKKYDKDVLKSVSFEMIRGQKIAIIGKNGVGKTTLLKILAQKTQPNSGEIIWGKHVDLGYYAQEYEGLDYKMSVVENFTEAARLKELGIGRIRAILGAFLFPGDKIEQRVSSLSGGEKTRLALSKLFASGYNFLLLDEPTTYLDPASKDILLDALKEYKGTVLLVSHEPEFVNSLKVDRVLLMPEEKIDFMKDEYLSRIGII